MPGFWRLCRLLLVCAAGLFLLPAAGARAEPAGLAKKELTVSIDRNYPPYIFLGTDDELHGYLVDLWRLWEKTTGVRAHLQASDWQKAQEALASGSADVIDTIFHSPERAKRLAFSAPYARLPVPIYVHREIGGITGINTLRGFVVAVKSGDACAERLQSLGVSSLKLFADYEAIIRDAAAGATRVFCVDEPPANYLLARNGIAGSFYKAFTLYSGNFHRAVNKGNEELLDFVERGFAAIPEHEYTALRAKWFGADLAAPPWQRFWFYALPIIGALLLLLVWWGLVQRRRAGERARQLSKERAQLHTLFNLLPDLAWMKNSAGTYVACNAALASFFNLKAEEVIGRSDYELMSREHADFVRQRDQVAIVRRETNVSEETVFSPGKGRDLILETVKTAVFDDDGWLVGVLGIGRDITARRRDEESLRLAARVFDSTTEGIFITGRDGMIQTANPAFSSITGHALADVLGQRPDFLRSDRHPPAFYRELWARLDAEGSWQGEIWSQRKNGEIFPSWETISAVRDRSGEVTHYVTVFSDISAVKRSQEALDFLAHHDSLTGLPNRLLLRDRLAHALEKSAREKRRLAVLFIDLDRFKQINDTLGHAIGDALLRAVANAMSDSLRAGDTLARIGGDEFVALLEEGISAERVAVVAGKLIKTLSRSFNINGHELFISASIGISIYPDDGTGIDSLLINADAAMYQAKERGRNNFQFYEAVRNENLGEHLRLEKDLRSAALRNELCLHYQPQIELASGRIVGVEALLRWQHPELGLLPPERFLPIAEESGASSEIDTLVLKAACQQFARWKAAGLALPRLAVNVAPHLLEQADLPTRLAGIIALNAISGSELQLEVKESLLAGRSARVAANLRALGELGVTLAIDDFGSGGAALARLSELPVRSLKIDRAFISALGEGRDVGAIVRSIVALGASLGMATVVKGVEEAAQAELFAGAGCQSAQGFFYAPALPADACAEFIRQR